MREYYGEPIHRERFQTPKNILFFVVGSFLFLTFMAGGDLGLWAILPIAFFELFPIGYALWYPTKVSFFLQDNFLIVVDEFIALRQPKVSRFRFEELRDLHFLIYSGEHNRKSYALAYTDSAGVSRSLMPAMSYHCSECVYKLLRERIGESVIVREEPETRYINVGVLLREYGWVLAVMFFSPLLLAIGSFGGGETSSGEKISFPAEIPVQNRSYVQRELSEQCGGKPYCIVAFYATWCSTSAKTRYIVPEFKQYFSGSQEVGVAEYLRTTSWGLDGAEKDDWQREIQRSLFAGLQVPAFVLVEDGERVLGVYHGGPAGRGSPDHIKDFLTDKLGGGFLTW